MGHLPYPLFPPRIRRGQNPRQSADVPMAEHVGQLDPRGKSHDRFPGLAPDFTKDFVQSHQQER